MAKSKYRTTGPDVLQPPPKAKPQDKPGTVPGHRLAVFDHLGRMRATVSHKATEAGVLRYIGGRGATLSKDENGKPCWRGKPPIK
jgi:hypothetical protein